jgi:hypothetical protein
MLGVIAVAGAACDPFDRALAWSVRRGQVGEFAVRGDEVFTIGDRLAVYDATTGQRRRSTALPADLGDTTRGQLGPGALVAGDAVVFGWYDFSTETGTVFCFDATTLAPRWQWQIQWPWRRHTLRPTLAVTASGAGLYAAAIGKDGDNLFAFRAGDGRFLWARSVETFPAEAGLAIVGDRLLVRSQLWAWTRDRHEQLDAINVDDGRRLWRTWLIGEAKYHLGSPLIDGGHVYTTTRADSGGGHLYVVRLSDGHTWREPIATAGTPFAKRGDTIYLGGTPATAWDTRAHRPVWAARDDSDDAAMLGVLADGAIDDERGRIFTGDSQRFVYVRTAATGHLERRLRLDHHLRFELLRPLKALYGSYGARRLQVHREMLFVGTVDGSLFVYRLDAI